MLIEMIDPKINRKVWASGAYAGTDLTYYEAHIYDNPDGKGSPCGKVTWPTKDNWAEHRFDNETGKCRVKDCNGWCEDESNACTWLDKDAKFEYFDI